MKLRYLIPKEDVGTGKGGLQNKGLKRAVETQRAQSYEATETDPSAWEWRRKFPKNKGRLSAPRARLVVDQRAVRGARIGGV